MGSFRFDRLEKIYDSFYSTIKEADTDQLDKFIDNYRESVLKGFIEGIEKDLKEKDTEK